MNDMELSIISTVLLLFFLLLESDNGFCDHASTTIIIYGESPSEKFNYSIAGAYLYCNSDTYCHERPKREPLYFNAKKNVVSLDLNEEKVIATLSADSKFSLVNSDGEWIASELRFISFSSGYTPTWFKNSYYTLIDEKMSQKSAQEVCAALDGNLVVPNFKSIHTYVTSLLQNLHTYWLGFQMINYAWQWKLNHGQGATFNLTTDMYNNWDSSEKEGNCSVISKSHSSVWKRETCEALNRPICRTVQYTQRKYDSIRVFENARSYSDALSECSKHGNGTLLYTSYSKLQWLSGFMKYYNYEGLYFVDGKYNEEDQMYRIQHGAVISPYLWHEGHPNKSLHCVVSDKNGRLMSYDCENETKFVCEFPSSADTVVLGTLDNIIYWFGKSKMKFENAKDLCDEQEAYLLTYNSIWKFLSMLNELYLVQGIINKDYWFILPHGYKVEDYHVISEDQSHQSSQFCQTVKTLHTPAILVRDCRETHYYICETKYKENIYSPKTANYCVPGFERYSETRCLRYYNEPVSWPVAHTTCLSDTKGLGALVKTYALTSIYLRYFIKKKNLAEGMMIWTGMCGQGHTKLIWTAEKNEKVEISLQESTLSDQCAKLSSSDSALLFQDNIYHISNITEIYTFACEHSAITISYLNFLKFSSNSSISTNTKIFQSVDYCPYGYLSYDQFCIYLNATIKNWEEALESCYIADQSGKLVIDDTAYKHEILTTSILGFRWSMRSRRFWIGLNRRNSESFEYAGTNTKVTEFQAWEDEAETQIGDCVAAYSMGKWKVLNCSTALPYICQVNQCYKGSSKNYNGTVNKTVSGYLCEYWNSTNSSIYRTLQNLDEFQDNYCRDDGTYYQPWCFTKSLDMRYEICDVQQCSATDEITRPYDYTYRRYSELHPADRNDSIPLQCPVLDILIRCQCGNDHCIGTELSIFNDQSGNGSKFHNYSCNTIPKSYKDEKFQTRGLIYCKTLKPSSFITISVSTVIGISPSIFCPWRMKLVSCSLMDKQIPLNQTTLGKGMITKDNDNIERCVGIPCYGPECQISAVCIHESSQNLDSQGKRPTIGTRVVQIPLLMKPIQKQQDSMLYSFSLGQIQTFCFWLKLKSHNGLGTVLYVARHYQYPIMVLTGGNTSDSGFFLAPNGENFQFNPTKLLDDTWHHVCFVFGAQIRSHSHCQLYFDSFLIVQTTGMIPCNNSHFIPNGHFSFGRGDLFTPWFTKEGRIFEQQKTKLVEKAEKLLYQPFTGLIGDLTTFNKAFSASEILNIYFQCGMEDWKYGEPPDKFSSDNSYNKNSFISNAVQIYGNISLYQEMKPCYEAVLKYQIEIVVEAVAISSSAVNITTHFYNQNYSSILDFGISSFMQLVECTMQGSNHVERKYTAQSKIEGLSSNVTVIIPILSLRSGTFYACTINTHLNSWEDHKNNYFRQLNFTTALGKVKMTRSIVDVQKDKPSYELLTAGTDLITWNPPTYGDVTEYNVTVLLHNNDGEFIQATHETIDTNVHSAYYAIPNSEGKNLDALILPGDIYKVQIVGIHQGREGDKKLYSNRLQPNTPSIVKAIPISAKNFAKLLVKWQDPYNQYVEGYVMEYRKNTEVSWKSLTLPHASGEYILSNLEEETLYNIKMHSFAGKKQSTESSIQAKTGKLLNGDIKISRVSISSVTITWNVNKLCDKYVVEAKVMDTIDPKKSKDLSTCFLSGASTESVVVGDIYCSEYIRRFQNNLHYVIHGLQPGCIYEASVKHPDPTGINYIELEKIFNNPGPITKVEYLVLQHSTESLLSFKWNEPDVDEMVDSFQVVLMFGMTPRIPHQWSIVNKAQIEFSELKEATEYVVNVVSIRGLDSGAEVARLTAWTTWKNSLHAKWSNWTEFSECPKTCGEGLLQVRKRFCLTPALNIVKECTVDGVKTKEQVESKLCSLSACPVDGKWSVWSDYSKCSKTCDGYHVRKRNCTNPSPAYGGMECNGGELWKSENKSCGADPCPINGGWTFWINKTECSETCGGGKKHRFRLCRNPVPRNDGKFCTGPSEDTIECSTEMCPVPGNWDKWSRWTECINICGIVNSTRTRKCIQSITGHWCSGADPEKETETKLCISPAPCNEDFYWSSWSLFTSCDHTCGNRALRHRIRKCIWNDEIYQEARPCEQIQKQEFLCGPLNCPVAGSWGVWSTWSLCTVSCGPGTQIRFRLCEDPVPEHGGKECPGSKTGSQMEEKECVERNCPSGRYVNSDSYIPHCDPTKGESGIHWEWTFAGTSQQQPCPGKTIGICTRKCLQNDQWQSEDLTNCTSIVIQDIVNNIKALDTGTSSSFNNVSSHLLQVLDGDINGKNLRVSGDVIAIHNILATLMSWKPSAFSDISRASKLEYVNTVTTATEKITNNKYRKLWLGMNGTVILETIKNMLNLIEHTSKYGLDVITSDSSIVFKNNQNKDFNILLQTIRSSDGLTSVIFPKKGSLEYELESSTIDIKLHPNINGYLNSDSAAALQLMFVKYNSINVLLHKLNGKIVNKTGRQFNGRKINGILIGAMARLSTKGTIADFIKEVRIVFRHKRKVKNQLCVYIDERSGNWLFNEAGCTLDEFNSTDETTVCICNHLTTFTVLSHHLLDKELQFKMQFQDYQSLYGHVSLVCASTFLVILVLVLVPTVTLKFYSGLHIHTAVSYILRHGAVYCALIFNSSDSACSVAVAVLVYTCMANVSWILMNMLDVLSEIKCGTKRSQENFSFMSWVMPLSFILLVLGTFGIFASKDIVISCSETYSLEMLSPFIVLIAFVFISTLVLLIYSIYVFVKTPLKPFEANRLEKRIWLTGILFFTTLLSIILLFISFIGIKYPSKHVQRAYIFAVSIEMIFFGLMHLWMDKEIRAYYYRKFGAKPVEEKVRTQPPKYIP